MKKKILILTVILGTLFLSCKKEKNNPNNSINTTGQCVTIYGYTSKDVTNASTGITDTTDWRLDDNWTQCERDLFGGTNYNTACIFDDTLLSNPSGYPNPTTNLFHFDIGRHIISSDTNLINSIIHHDSTITVDLLVLNQRNQQVGFIHSNKNAVKLIS